MTEESVNLYKESMNQEINLVGFNLGTMEELAIADALKIQVPGKVPVLMEISIDCDYNIFKIDRPEYTPYNDLE